MDNDSFVARSPPCSPPLVIAIRRGARATLNTDQQPNEDADWRAIVWCDANRVQLPFPSLLSPRSSVQTSKIGRRDHSAARLNFEQDRLKETQDWSEDELVEAFERWARNPKVREWVCGSCNDPVERARKLRAIFGVVLVCRVEVSPSQSK